MQQDAYKNNPNQNVDSHIEVVLSFYQMVYSQSPPHIFDSPSTSASNNLVVTFKFSIRPCS